MRIGGLDVFALGILDGKVGLELAGLVGPDHELSDVKPLLRLDVFDHDVTSVFHCGDEAVQSGLDPHVVAGALVRQLLGANGLTQLVQAVSVDRPSVAHPALSQPRAVRVFFEGVQVVVEVEIGMVAQCSIVIVGKPLDVTVV